MKTIIRFFLSVKTAFGLFIITILLMLAGSIGLPANLSFFSGINDVPLFKWLADAGNPKLTWWIYMLIASLSVFAVSTIFCTVESLMQKMNRYNIVLKLSPQIMHIGVLFIMLGHLLTASTGFKADVVINKGEQKDIEGSVSLYLEDIKVQTDKNGYAENWEAALWLLEDGKRLKKALLKPVHPIYFREYGLYSKTVSLEESSALIRVCRDPGALWALIGGAILIVGCLAFIYGRFREKSVNIIFP